MKTIAEQLKIKDFPFEIKDSKGNIIYYEDSKGHWIKNEFDYKGNLIYFENLTDYWYKYEINSNNKQTYHEDLEDLIIDNRPKEVTLSMNEIADKFNINVKNLKIKK